MDLYIDYIMIYFNTIVRALLMILFYLVSSVISERILRSYHDFALGKIESGNAGCETAIDIMHKNDVYDIDVLPKAGLFSDSFSRLGKRITLSKKIYSGRSITASAIAAQKSAHAIIASRKFSLMSLFIAFKPVVRVVNAIYLLLVMISVVASLVWHSDFMFYVFIAVLALQVITLPTVYNTNAIAIRELKETGILNEEERYGAKKVLRSLSFTHIAAIVITLIYVVRF